MYLDEKTSGEALPDLGTLRVDRILMLADEIERPTKGMGFNMEFWMPTETSCGTACCIGGHANLMFGGPVNGSFDVTGDLLGLTKEQTVNLFTPYGWHFERKLNDRPRAARVLRHLASTGKVDWSV